MMEAGGIVKHLEVKQTWGGAVRGILQVFLDAVVWIRVVGTPPTITAEDNQQEQNHNTQCKHECKVVQLTQITCK